jgi:hypothetical protein
MPRAWACHGRAAEEYHLASIDFLIQRRLVRLATYDRRLAAAAAAMGVSLIDLA